MRSLSLLSLLAAACSHDALQLPLSSDGGLVAHDLAVAAAADLSSASCDGLDEIGCSARNDCHSVYSLLACRPDNTSWCPMYSRCVSGPAQCDPAVDACDHLPPPCPTELGFVVSYNRETHCDDGCVKSSECNNCKIDGDCWVGQRCCDDGKTKTCSTPENDVCPPSR